MPDARFYLTGEPLKADVAAALVDARLERAGAGALIRRVGSLGEEDISDALVFADSQKALAGLEGRAAAMCLAPASVAGAAGPDGALAIHSNPRRAFALLAARLHRLRQGGLSAGVSASAEIGAGARIHSTAVVEENAIIGVRTAIGPFAYIGPGVVIGEDCEIGAGASMICALIGARAIILSGARIGEAGFGFAASESGFVRMPQLGRVVIGEDVEIGANSTIDRGALGDTVIEDGVKIDNLVQIGHNVRIGKGSALAAQVGVSGSTTIGAGVVLGGQAGLADHLKIGSGARIAARAGLMRDVPPGEAWGGAPARPIKEWFRETAALTKLAARKKTKDHGED